MNSPDLTGANSDISIFVESQDAIFRRLDQYVPCSATDNSTKMLAAMWQYLPPDGRANLVEDVLGCSSNVDIKQLADSVVSGLLNPMQAFGGQTAQPTPSPRFGLEDSIDNLESMLNETITSSD